MARPGDPKVGPADRETVHRELEKRLKSDSEYQKSHPVSTPTSSPAPERHRELRQGPQGKTVMESVDAMARGTDIGSITEHARRAGNSGQVYGN